MINLKEINSKCFALRINDECEVLKTKEEKCDYSCAFYKPIGCEDWMRREKGDEIWLIPPEEYFVESVEENSQNGEHKK